jgi:hypothetical protein
MPAAVFTDPQVASVGTTSGDQVVTGVHMIAGGKRSTCARRDLLEPAVGTNESVIVGALAVGPEAGEWIGQLTLAVRARMPMEILLPTTQPYLMLSGALSGLHDPAARRPASGTFARQALRAIGIRASGFGSCAEAGIRARGFRSALKGPAGRAALSVEKSRAARNYGAGLKVRTSCGVSEPFSLLWYCCSASWFSFASRMKKPLFVPEY